MRGRRAYPLYVRPARLIAVLIALAAFAGCDSESDSEPRSQASPRTQSAPDDGGTRSDEGRVIRDWLLALERSDYGQAATYFARGALIDQGRPFRLRNRAAARIFNATLPCRARLVKLDDEGRRVLASFRLSAGPGGPCDGVVQVRFTFNANGQFTEWRQLPGGNQGQEPPGQAI